MKLCQHCNSRIPDDSIFCQYCGANPSQADGSPALTNVGTTIRFCRYCSEPIKPGDVFCSLCGAELENVGIHIAEEPQQGNGSVGAQGGDYYIGRIPVSQDLVQRVISLLSSSRKLDAIKLVRENTGLGLKDAKTWVENYKAYNINAPHDIVELTSSTATASAQRLCPYCNSEVPAGCTSCPTCGGTISQPSAGANRAAPANDSVSVGLVILSVFLPLFGIIYWPVKAKTRPKNAKACGIAAIISWAANCLFSMASVNALFNMLGI